MRALSDVKSCRTCGASIVWLTTARGARMPVDADTVGFGHMVFDTGKGHVSHWATCKNPPPRSPAIRRT